MEQKALMTGPEVFELLPQRPPMIMVDKLYNAGKQCAETGLTVLKDNVFCLDGHLIEPGIVEHSAQSAAVFAGYKYYLCGEKPHIGLIGEIKDFHIRRLPAVGEEIRTEVTILGEAFGMSLVETVSTVSGEEVAGGRIKIFIQE
ncbi:MAG: hydroxymyristoyl-ACP dehydratase [Bacteroidales bacterium]|nr:hydroxymyristoyl-ACP dehydratase [Bacteroidales bacterium]